ncbi:Ig-like domain-containing protein [Paraferrimonas sp. SM1919]|uniref:Ig-like domain-containing protein n=1 Tax=Paraferrimonas sp. SM1919 TaxID=2662263 RepID=UPI0013D34FC5|nr:Ig-like domain-containing protein [Paraferrimonas sp. SM1919]
MKRVNHFLLNSIALCMIAACGGSDTNTQSNSEIYIPNSAPVHNGNLTYTVTESDPEFVVDLLEGTFDQDSDTLVVVDIQLAQASPTIGSIVGENTISFTPSSFSDGIADGESEVIRYHYTISDGKDTIERTLAVLVYGEGLASSDKEIDTNAEQIYVNLNSQQYFANSGELERKKFFNIHTNFLQQDNPTEHIELYTKQWNVSHGRGFWSGISVAKQKMGDGQYPATEFAIAEGPKNIEAYYSNPHQPLADNRRIDTERGPSYIVPGANAIEGARWIADYYEHYFDANSRPLFVEPMNEPFIQIWKDEYSNVSSEPSIIRAEIANWLKEIGKAFDERPALSGMSMLGYAAAWPSFERDNFGHWQSEMKMYMDTAGDYTDSFSIHLYNGINQGQGQDTKRTGSNSQATLDLIETYSHFKWDTVKPHSISEYGSIIAGKNENDENYDTSYSPWANSVRIRSINQLLIELLNREERILTSIPFLTGTAAWHWKDPEIGNGDPYNASLWRPDPAKIELVAGINGAPNRWQFIDGSDPENYLPNHNQIFFEMWKDVAGRRLAIHSHDPDLQQVAYTNDNQTFIILTNLEDDQAKQVQLNIEAIEGVNYTSIRTERIAFNDIDGALYSDDTIESTKLVGATLPSFTIAAGETIKLTLNKTASIKAENFYQRSLYYSDQHIVPINANEAAIFNIDNVDVGKLNSTAHNSVSLRMSLARAPSKNKIPELFFNNVKIAVPNDWAGYDQADRDTFFGAIEIPVPRQLLAQNNVIKAVYATDGGHISSMVLTVNNDIEPIPVESLQVNGNLSIAQGNSFQATVTALPSYASDLTVNWSSSDTTVAVIDTQGKITALEQGTTIISATSVNGPSASFSLTVKPPHKNLLQELNPGFELGTLGLWLSNWNNPSNIELNVTAEASFEGEYGLHMLFDGSTIGASDPSNAVAGITLSENNFPQIFGEAKGRQFKLTFDIKSNIGVDQWRWIKFRMIANGYFANRFEQAMYPWSTIDDPELRKQWQRVELVFDEQDWSVEQSQNVNYRGELFIPLTGGINEGKSGDFFIDNISIEIVE